MEQNTVSSYENKLSAEDVSPLSVFSMQFSAMEMEHALLQHAAPLLKKCKRNVIIITLLGVVLLFLSHDGTHTFTAAFISITICFAAYFLAWIQSVKKNAKMNALESEQSRDVYEVFEDHVKVTVYVKENLKTVRYIDYEEIDEFNENESYFFFVKRNILYLLRKNDQACNVLADKIRSKARCEAVKNKKTEDRKEILSTVLGLLDLLALVAALLLRNCLSYDILESMPMQFEFFLLVIPVGVLLASIFLRKKIKYKATLALSIISGVLLCCCAAAYGYQDSANSYLDENQQAISEEIVAETESILNIDIPDNAETVYAYAYDDLDRSTVGLELDEDTGAAFLASIKKDANWLDYAPSILEGLKDYYTEDEYSLLYNIDTKQYNALPEEEGTYEFLLLSYSEEFKSLNITRYTTDYIEYIQ